MLLGQRDEQRDEQRYGQMNTCAASLGNGRDSELQGKGNSRAVVGPCRA